MDLAAEIEKLLNEQYDLANKVLDEAAKKASDEAVKELKSSSPKKTGKYAKGWGKTDTSGIVGGKQYTVHNSATRIRGDDPEVDEKFYLDDECYPHTRG